MRFKPYCRNISVTDLIGFIEFVLKALALAHPYTNPMFGCTAIYVGDKIVLRVRDRESSPRDNGVWLATTVEHHESLKKTFPTLRSIEVFGGGCA